MSGNQPEITCRFCGRKLVCQICAACALHHTDLYPPSYTKVGQDRSGKAQRPREPRQRASASVGIQTTSAGERHG